MYGKELILDLYNCDVSTFNRNSIMDYCEDIAKLIKVELGDLYFWDDVGVSRKERQTNPKTIGTSAVQFILTSNITIHTLDKLEQVYLNIFSCDEFNAEQVVKFSIKWFDGKVYKQSVIERG